ncbi:hypothetical protein [Mesorhizobium sp. dw_380]|uniref:hypothetical protein n=1 Tax=Mesorhizobium sp. dw_380 TaxID=2812001 RepID=UPI001BDE29C8|nr:hypothetical protein [Mesorhizobium sp. dw_380]
MKRQMMLTGAILLAAASAISFSTVADAAVARHHYVDVTIHRGDRHRHAVHHEYVWVGGGWTGDNSSSDNGWMDSYYNGYGSYRGYVGDFCGTIAWTLDLCSPHGP